MRKLYNEFFYIPKHGKVREKVMLTRLTMTITIVIMCLAAMSITAYAYFSYNITSGKDGGDVGARLFTDEVVGVNERHSVFLRKQFTECGLAATGRTEQRHKRAAVD